MQKMLFSIVSGVMIEEVAVSKSVSNRAKISKKHIEITFISQLHATYDIHYVPSRKFRQFSSTNFTSFSSRIITRFWIGDKNIPLLSFPKKCVSRNDFHKGSFLR